MEPHSDGQGNSSDLKPVDSASPDSHNGTISFPAFNPVISSGSSSRAGVAARVEKQRNRRGSLRRSAILGGGEGRMRDLERRGLGERALVEMGLLPGDASERRFEQSNSPKEEVASPDRQTREAHVQEASPSAGVLDSLNDTTPSELSTMTRSPTELLRLDTTSAELSRQLSPTSSVTSPLTSPHYGSTTDDDDGLHLKVNRSISAALSHPDPAAAMADLHRRLNARTPPASAAPLDTSNTLSAHLTPSTTASSMASTTAVSSSVAPTSTNPPLTAPSLSTTSSSLTPSSSTAPPLPSTTPSMSQGHDYAATERWGYTILILTWLVFVIGMGSCFDLWSWAWDVGQTPYAPPELEDDDSLPIVGYYPALMALAGVMAWVWVTVAWVGMKSFRHAKVLDLQE